MNESTPPSRDRVNFPRGISAGAGERQTQYRNRHQSGVEAGVEAGVEGGVEGGVEQARGTADASAAPEALVALVQTLTQQNHVLSDRVKHLEETLASMQAETKASASPADAHPDASSDARVAYLLNQLEFAQQTNQRQAIRIENLAQQVNTDRLQLQQLEQDSQAFQHRCRTQTNRIEQLEQRCEELQQRLQRQQRYTLQFKTALDKCLEVPPPSYTTPEAAVSPELTHTNLGKTAAPPEEELTSLVPPLFPKVGDIPTWSQSESGKTRLGQTSTGSGIGVVEPIRPLKPELQVPDMSRFKTALFNLAHQSRAAAAGIDHQFNADQQDEDRRGSDMPVDNVPGDGVVSSDGVPANTPHSDAGHSDSHISEASPRPAGPITTALPYEQVGADAAISAPTPTASTAASADDAFWAGLVQKVSEVNPDAPPTPQDDTPQAEPLSHPVPPQQARSAKGRGDTSQGVDTLFDVVLQGAKAIASQFMPSDTNSPPSDNTADTGADSVALPQSALQPQHTSLEESPSTVPLTAAQDAEGGSGPAPSTPTTSLQAGWPSPKLSPGPEKREGQRRPQKHSIDLPTFLRPQPQ